jgi:hypothetical protein
VYNYGSPVNIPVYDDEIGEDEEEQSVSAASEVPSFIVTLLLIK